MIDGSPRSGRAMAFLLVAAALAGPAAGASPERVETSHVTVSLVAGVEAVQPGTTFALGLRFELEDEWHVYWENPGDSGMEVQVRWRLPRGFEAGPVHWPAPKRIPVKHLVNFGYEDEVVLFSEVRPPEDLEGTEVALGAKVDWLACRVECIPGSARLETSLPVEPLARPDRDVQETLTATRARLPIPAERLGAEVAAVATSDAVDVHVRLPGAPGGEVVLFPRAPGLVANAAPQRVVRQGDRLRVRVPRDPAGDTDLPERLTGMLVSSEGWRGPDTEPALALDVAWSETPPPWAASAEADAEPALSLVLLGAFVGGLLLNLMPCVLPVLSLKVISFARAASHGRGTALRHALAFAAGLVATFWVVAGALLLLRSAGESLGWGFQLQSPTFVVLLCALFFLLGLNLFGVFEIGVPGTGLGGSLASRHDLVGAFASGVLATVVATPCTAPFMGTALGVALVGSAWRALLVFSALGAGMALPYVLLSAFPPLLARLPKPGPWMDTLKQALGFLLMGTVAWLLWVFGHQVDAAGEVIGVDGVARLLAALVVLAAGAWVLGRFGTPSASRRGRAVARAAAIAALFAGLAVPLLATLRPSVGPEWRAFSPELVAELEEAGTPYFIDFTASWCLTCQVNKAVALDRPAVRSAFEQHDIVPIEADWTNESETITSALAAHGRSSVPLYVLRGADGEPVILPQVLTESIVLETIESRVARR